MKYFRAVNPEDATDILYVTCDKDLSADLATESLGFSDLGYVLHECLKEEFETMTQYENDYIIKVGHDEDNLTPFDSAPTYEEGVKKGEKYLEDWEYVELVYMPCGDEDTNDDTDLVVWFKSR